MIIGFGSTETDRENDFGRQFAEIVREEYANGEATYFTDATIKRVEARVKAIADELHAIGNKHKNSDAPPERYGYFWWSILSDASNVVAVISWHHINRRHAFSPDGWALMQNKSLHHVSSIDLDCPA